VDWHRARRCGKDRKTIPLPSVERGSRPQNVTLISRIGGQLVPNELVKRRIVNAMKSGAKPATGAISDPGRQKLLGEMPCCR
jgi:hypothetical protein